jgi:hypothetical protein
MTAECYEHWNVRNTKIAEDGLTCYNELVKNLSYESGMVDINDWASVMKSGMVGINDWASVTNQEW